MRSKPVDIRQASPREQSRWLRDRGWKAIIFNGDIHYVEEHRWALSMNAKTYPLDEAVKRELAAEAQRQRRARRGGK